MKNRSKVWLKDEATGIRHTFYGQSSDEACSKARKFAQRVLKEAAMDGKQVNERFYLTTGGETYSIEIGA